MRLNITKEWLTRLLSHADDTKAGAGGTDIDSLKKEAELRTVTPTIFAETPTDVGKVVRFARERRGWSVQFLAEIADVDEEEIKFIEMSENYTPSPRSIAYIADALDFSRNRLQELVGFVVRKETEIDRERLPFAANSNGIHSLSEDEFEAIRALVEILSKEK